ncbi:myb-related protein P [Ananas comosus]|uniref:Myb-related protein 340 n=2 Tax=Ananas comosus TaxID=4615 RepID=A0A199UIM7_ANACO|nr:myb-related protein P [Ananas comosus]OAY64589.1 Myb-related protein 340 [Ananas comosus]CAD1836063.1 unnamed protein product [Ananas comosus var. bracteatus]
MESHFGWESALHEDGWRKGPWTSEEDKLLMQHVNQHGEGRWNSVSKLTGLRRSGKSCRLRWVNYLRPDLKKGKITPQEENIILELHALWGNRWSTIARSLPGRTDNEIKNYWRTHYKKSKPSKSVERARAQFLKHQQLERKKQQLQQQQQLQLQQLQQLQQQEQVLLMHPYDMQQRLTAGAEKEAEALAVAAQQQMQEMDQFLLYPGSYDLLQGSSSGGGGGGTTSEDGSTTEDGGGGWGSLWNLDDVYGDVGVGRVGCRGNLVMRAEEFAFYYNNNNNN